MDYPINKCKSCVRYDHENYKMKNKLRCMFSCNEYMIYLKRKAIEYNRAVSSDDFDTNEIFEHGKKVVGSGWKDKTW